MKATSRGEWKPATNQHSEQHLTHDNGNSLLKIFGSLKTHLIPLHTWGSAYLCQQSNNWPQGFNNSRKISIKTIHFRELRSPYIYLHMMLRLNSKRNIWLFQHILEWNERALVLWSKKVSVLRPDTNHVGWSRLPFSSLPLDAYLVPTKRSSSSPPVRYIFNLGPALCKEYMRSGAVSVRSLGESQGADVLPYMGPNCPIWPPLVPRLERLPVKR